MIKTEILPKFPSEQDRWQRLFADTRQFGETLLNGWQIRWSDRAGPILEPFQIDPTRLDFHSSGSCTRPSDTIIKTSNSFPCVFLDSYKQDN